VLRLKFVNVLDIFYVVISLAATNI